MGDSKPPLSKKKEFVEHTLSSIDLIKMLIYTGVCACSVAHSCLTAQPMDCNPPVSSVHGISQARILEQVPISFSGDLPDPGIEPASFASPALAGGCHLGSPCIPTHAHMYLFTFYFELILNLLKSLNFLK